MVVKQVLVIDDEADMREVTQISLEIMAGFEVIVACSSQEGIAKAALEQPDVILLDVMMPGIDGITTLKQLKSSSHTQHIPVIFLTAKTQPVDHQHFVNLGAKAIITKPFKPSNLVQQLQMILGWNLAAVDSLERD